MDKRELLDKITTHYLHSCDFNGITLHDLPAFDLRDLEQLIKDGDVFILSESNNLNIFINCLNLFGTPTEQIERLHSRRMYAIYPSPQHLGTRDIREEKPFTEMLAKGMEQLRVLYFSPDALEIYANDPRYTFQDHGYGGTIFCNDTGEADDPIHSEYIKDFGVAYPTTPPYDRDRAIGIFLRDLSKLNLEAQYKWRGFLLKDQEAFRVNGGFVDNLIYGRWVTSHWIFDSLLEEIKYINVLCKNIGIPPMFNKEFSRDSQELIGYRIVLIPSLKNYYEFVSALEKIVIHNINCRSFLVAAPYIHPIDRNDDQGNPKGTLVMLEEWMNQNYCSSNPAVKEKFKAEVIDTLRLVRKIRQAPAHELYSNKHDKTLYKQQNELISKLYDALMIIRIILNNHPRNKGVTEPESLRDPQNIAIY